ncbi:uncharacterized protein LOC119382270 [Rhipicephalus sanguineus]|uniref:uncharacterized protein LOC119382270 n=1 Tax=Rhipicephalus sanguineus TaxID=34632 RepID=UPI001893FC77|nr:uncharacterized protein LOC119382270 [Rhipicephalus sanguineus]
MAERPILLISKARVASIRKATLPRLELLGALVGAKLLTYVSSALNDIHIEYTMWTDSTIVLSWIRGDCTRWKQFIANRITDIKCRTKPSRWRYCPGLENPSDLLTRGVTLDKVRSSSVWWHGPDWLHGSVEKWPLQPLISPDMDEAARSEIAAVQVVTATERLIPIINIERFSKLQHLLRITAWVFRFTDRCRHKTEETSHLTATEVLRSEHYSVKHVQNQEFHAEVNCLTRGRTLEPMSCIANLRPFIDADVILRVGGRLSLLKSPLTVKHPILLPAKHHYSALVVIRAHQQVLHNGARETFTQLREHYWICRGRVLVKKVIRSCNVCKRFAARPGSAPTAPLPSHRIEPTNPFEVVGVDFAGPLLARTQDGDAKCNVALFTCAVSRAIHLELVSNITAETFILCLRRFVSRRGLPRVIYSDNARTFQKTSADLKRLCHIFKEEDVANHLTVNGITWKFIVPNAPWWGGWWERLIRSVKTSLRKILGRACLNFEEIMTVLTEVEAVINSKPLTFVQTDETEPCTLTPADLLLGRRLTAMPYDTVDVDANSRRSDVIRRHAYRRLLTENFWKR